MRETIRTFTIYNNTSSQKQATIEEILSINENKQMRFINVVVGYKVDEVSDFIQNVNDIYEIVGDNYDLLMSENPEFAEGKPQNEYREADVWHIIDLIRS